MPQVSLLSWGWRQNLKSELELQVIKTTTKQKKTTIKSPKQLDGEESTGRKAPGMHCMSF